MKQRGMIVPIILIVVALIAVGFGIKQMNKKGKVVNTPTQSSQNKPANTQPTTNNNNTVSNCNGRLISGWPTDVPLYPGASVCSSDKNPLKPNDPKAFMSKLQTTVAKETVSAYYSTSLVSSGWKIQSNNTVSGNTLIVAKKDTRKLNITIGNKQKAANGNTTIDLVLSTD